MAQVNPQIDWREQTWRQPFDIARAEVTDIKQ
jgi:hypothetical protein